MDIFYREIWTTARTCKNPAPDSERENMRKSPLLRFGPRKGTEHSKRRIEGLLK